MNTEHANYHVITGGPGSGKTSLIEALRARGFRCVDEVGRRIIRAQLAIGGNALHWGDRAAFAELMLSHSILDHEGLRDDGAPAFFDRAVPDLIGYCRLIGVPVPDHFRNAARLFRYSPVVFVAPPWREVYRNDAERKQDFAEAIATFEAVVAGYREVGYEPVKIPMLPLAGRVDFIVEQIEAG